MSSLRISEIFFSIQGESDRAGLPTTFVRLTGCPLRCHYCDTAYAFKGGESLGVAQVLERVQSYPTRYVTVTGGEPLAQPNCIALLAELVTHGFDISIETSGAISIADIPDQVTIIMDLKTPSSGESERNLWQNLELLKSSDQVKLVIGNRDDYEWACNLLQEYNLTRKVQVLMSPVWQQQSLSDLASWILSDGLSVRLQTQLHKVIWPGAGPGF